MVRTATNKKSRSLAAANRPDFAIEQGYRGTVCGIDEAGRGPLAGPVVAACVVIPADIRNRDFIEFLNDSKKLSASRRECLYDEIRRTCPFGTGQASAEEIDAINIHNASLLAMRRAYAAMRADFGLRADIALIDGKFTPDLECATRAVIKGDCVSASIAAASILAKETRDLLMQQLHFDYPAYAWDRNAGYGTRAHMDALKIHGVTPYHRQTYAPVKEAL